MSGNAESLLTHKRLHTCARTRHYVKPEIGFIGRFRPLKKRGIHFFFRKEKFGRQDGHFSPTINPFLLP